MPAGYRSWAGTLRINRRRFVALSTSAGALAMLACSSSNNNKSGAAPTATATVASSSSGTAAPRAVTAAATAAASGTPQAAALPLVNAGGTPKRGGHLGIAINTTTNLNTIANYSEGIYLSGGNSYDRLITSRSDQRRYVLEAALSVEQPDPLRVTFKLKPGMVYQNVAPVNGRAVVADDIVQTQMFGTSLANAYDPGFQKSYVDHVEAPDAQTVTYVLKKPDAYLFSATHLGNGSAQAIIPKEMLALDLSTTKAIGSGPWYLSDYQLNTRYLYKRFDQYRDTAKNLPWIDEREFISITDPVAQEAAYRSEQLSVWAPLPSNIDRVAADLGTKAVHYNFPGLAMYSWLLNMEHDTWHDVRVREALWRATNQQQFADLVFGKKATVQPGLVPAGLTAYQLDPKATAPYYANDLQKAKQLLAAAGWDASKEFEVICSSSIATNEQGAQVWQQQLAQIGVKVRVSSLAFAEWLTNRIAPANYDIVLGSSPGGDTPFVPIRMQATDQQNQYGHFGLHDPALDALIAQSETTTDFQENVKLVNQIQMMAIQEFSSAYEIVTLNTEGLINAKLHDFEINPAGSVVYNTQAWFSA